MQKSKSSHLISSDLIAGNHFKEIVKIFREKSELTNRDRYLYGYSLLRTQQKLESLVTLWPLVAKGHPKLQEDCATIAAHVFKEEDISSAAQLSEEALYTLFHAAKNLAPQSKIYSILKQRFFDFLWQKGDYEKLERILKSSKEEFSGVLIENLSKLAFFQSEKKLLGNAAAFVSLILTGGACLIIRDSTYQSEIADEIRLLANEIKHLFFQLQIKKKQKLAWDKSFFENLVDHEASILTQVLQLAVKDSEINLDFIPTPGYYMIYDSTTRRANQKFLPWLALENKELFEMYNADTHHAVLVALGEEKSFDTLNPNQINKFHPYLRLALMLRSTSIKKSLLSGIVQLSDFENVKESLFKNIAIQTVVSMIDSESAIKLIPAFWQMLSEFYPVIQAPVIKNALIIKSLYTLHQEYDDRIILNLVAIKNIAHQMNADELEKQADDLCVRQQLCLEFLLNLNSEKKSKRYITNIKDESTLRGHLTLIIDCCRLVYTKLSAEFFWHIKSLVKNKRINQIIHLKDIFDCDFKCDCDGCQDDFYQYEARNISNKLNLPVACLPDVHFYVNAQSISKKQPPKASVLSLTDPFKVLDVSFTDSKQIIMQKVMKLIQQSPGQMAIFRQAQIELFNPIQKFLHHYFRFLAYENRNAEDDVNQFSLPVISPLHDIPLRDEYLNAN